MRLCVRWLHVCAGEEKRTLRKSAFWAGDVTEKRILCRRRHLDVTEKRILCRRRHLDVTEKRILHQRRHRDVTKGRTLRVSLVAPRGHFRRSVYTPASPRPLARPGGALEPEAHATGAVTQPPTHTNSRNPPLACKKHPAAPYAPGLPSLLSRRALTWRRSCLSSLDASCIWSLTASWPVPP